MSDPSLDPSVYDPTAPNAHTLLRIVGMGVNPYSARGLKQTLTLIDQASQPKRMVDGTLKDISFAGFRKYKSTITGDDQAPPNFDGVYPGMQVSVDCIARLSRSDGATPGRTVVPGSEFDEGAHVYYRPRLIMNVISWNIDEDEYGAAVSWSLDLEEV